jgi:DNA polymerase I
MKYMFLVVAASAKAASPAAPSPEAATAAGAGEEAPAAYLQPTDAAGAPTGPVVVVPAGRLPETAARYEAEARERRQPLRWVWENTRDWYPQLLRRNVTVERSHDVVLVRAILACSAYAAPTSYIEGLHAAPAEEPDELLPRQLPPLPPAPDQYTLFDDAPPPRGLPLEELVREFAAQQEAVSRSVRRGPLALLLAAESAGALIAAEMQHTGLPWRADIHDRILTGLLGPRPREGLRPEKLERLAAELRALLNNPALNPDSPQELLRALHRAGIEVRTTRSWELREQNHPAIEPLLAYKKLSRLLAANGWAWLDAWVEDGRFRPEYVVGGVVSGRWATRGGGALQIPKLIRGAVRPDPGHRLVVADAAQLEPRVLAALAQDSQLAQAAQGRDLYAGIAAQGFGGDRAKAKVAMLGAMYGATTGDSGRLMPQLARTYPKAIDVVERAARAGATGQVVSSHLGRSCPPPSDSWRRSQQSTTAQEQQRAEAMARSRGRFTRNFVVQASAAEWALCWLGELRRRLRASAADGTAAGELVFFLHDEVMLHVPADRVDEACRHVTEAAAAATRLMFGRIPIEFAVNVSVVDSYADAK